MFHFGRFPSCTYVFSTGFMILHHEGFPIRKSAGRSLFAAHRSLSQLVTSFFGSWCQGIPLVLFFAWTPLYIFRYTLCSRLLELLCITFYSYFFSLTKLCFLFTQFYGKTFFFSLSFFVYLFVYFFSLFGFQWASLRISSIRMFALTYLPGQSPVKYCRHCAA